MEAQLSKKDFGYIMHLLSKDYRSAGGRGLNPEQIKRILAIKEEVVKIWLNWEDN